MNILHRALGLLAPLILAMILNTAFASDAQACTCMPPPPAAEAMERADAVFVGKVLRLHNDGHALRVHLELQENFKGLRAEPGDVVEIFTALSSAACGYSFRPETSYLVYGYFNERTGRVSASICSRTQEARGSHFEEERAILASASAGFDPVNAPIDAAPLQSPPSEIGSEPEQERRICPPGQEPIVSEWVCALSYPGPEGANLLDGSALPILCFVAGFPAPKSWHCQTPRPTLR